MGAAPRTVVLLTTWNRPALLAQSFPQIEREAASIGAELLISDDQSREEQTLVAVLYRAQDWRRLLATAAHARVVREGFDLCFAWHFAPRARPGAVAVCVQPSVVYHTGRNGLHVRDADLNCDYRGETDGLLVQ